jgi:eukaryotic-like serine/threonine-protein kinase
MPDDSVEVVLGGRYCLGEVLGTGRSATVYEATELPGHGTSPAGGQATVQGRLAAKVLHAHIADDPAVRAEFVLEARAGARVQHAGLVTVVDVGEEDIAQESVVWIMMVQAPGITVAEAVRSQVLSLSDSLGITSRVLDALAAVHDAGLVHRDISPGNVMVELTGRDGSAQPVGAVTVLDLGLAGAPGPSVVSSLTEPSGHADAPDLRLVTGTPAFMSPEQARGLTVDARGDLYAVGALLYLMLTGHAPYERSDPAAVLRAQVQAPVPVPSARTDVPPAVDSIVSRAMAKSPERRFASAAEMRTAVVAALGDVTTPAAAGTRVLVAEGGPSARTVRVSIPSLDRADPRPGVPGRRLPPVRPAAVPRPAVAAPSPAVAATQRPRTKAAASSSRMNAFLLVVCFLVVCGVAALGWMGTQEPTARANPVGLPRVPIAPHSTSGSPLASGPPAASVLPATTGLPSALPAATPGAVPTLTNAVNVPSLTFLGLEQARAALAAAGLILGEVSEQDSAQPAGSVLVVDPPAGRSVLAGSVVRLTVASGQNLVPSVQGLGLARAFAKVESTGLVPVMQLASDPSTPPGGVIGVSPDAGTKVPLGSVVTVFVSNGPPPSGPPTSTPPTWQPTPTPTPPNGQPPV